MEEDKLTIGQVNELLSRLHYNSIKSKYTLVSEDQDPAYYNEDYGDFGFKTSIFKLDIEDLHLKVVEYTNSYGNYQGIYELKIVRPIVKQVTDFE